MFNAVRVVIDAFVDDIEKTYRDLFQREGSEYADVLTLTARIALEALANTDSPYHDINHSILATQAGQEIMRGRFYARGDITPREWTHFMIAIVHHDIGYVRGVCRGDRGGRYVVTGTGETIAPPPGATDAFMTPYHVDRGKAFIAERYGAHPLIDTALVADMIERTRFPIPSDGEYAPTDDFAGLVRAADLIGQLGDPQYMQKLSKLYMEFTETGEAERLGYENAAQLRAAYPGFFWGVVKPYITDGINYLRKTQEGSQWVASLYSHVFSEEHEEPAYGPERRIGAERRSAPRASTGGAAGRRATDPRRPIAEPEDLTPTAGARAAALR